MMKVQKEDSQPETGGTPACSVLIVDDEKDFVHTLLKRLKRRGLACEGVFSGEEAIEAVKARKFNIVLLDMKLPGKDGNSTLVEIKKIQPDSEVIILTGHASVNDGIAGMQNGAMDYLMKPVEFESLFEMLLKAVRKTACSQNVPVRNKEEK